MAATNNVKARYKYNSRCAAMTSKFDVHLQEGKLMATLPDLAEQIHEGLVDSLDEEDYKEFRWSIEALLPLVVELRERL